MNRILLARADDVVDRIYRDLVAIVVVQGVFTDREGRLDDRAMAVVEAGRRKDPRPVRLLRRSGKGGYHPDPCRRERYARSRNCSLLDHLLSVARGAGMAAAVDVLHDNADAGDQLLRRVVALTTALAFLHDIDKDEGLERTDLVPVELVADRLTRYRLNEFLGLHQLQLRPETALHLIQTVEGSQRHRQLLGVQIPAGFERVPDYVRLADRLDGAFLSMDPSTGGVQGLLRTLAGLAPALCEGLPVAWSPAVLNDPHHPFLLDELQRWLSEACRELCGMRPLIEQHHDGVLLALLPAEVRSRIVEHGLDLLQAQLRELLSPTDIDINTRGGVTLTGTVPGFAQLRTLVGRKARAGLLSRLLVTSRNELDTLSQKLEPLLQRHDLALAPSVRATGQLVPLWASLERLTEAQLDLLVEAALLVIFVNLRLEQLPRIREQALMEVAGDLPAWVGGIKHELTRRTVLGLMLADRMQADAGIATRVHTLLAEWLGAVDADGSTRLEAALAAMRHRFATLLAGRAIPLGDEASQRCIVTNEPVANGRIQSSDGLYGLKVSAFSGRACRPEFLVGTDDSRRSTVVSPTTYLELRLRQQVHSRRRGSGETPVLLSSPSTMGLFGGLRMRQDQEITTVAIWDVLREKIEPASGQNVMTGAEIHEGRCRMGRLETLPKKEAELVDWLQAVLKASLGVGRPFHIFAGLPTPSPAFFRADCLPGWLSRAIDGEDLRLEQLPRAVTALERLKTAIVTRGVGLDWAKRLALPSTRFAAACVVLARLERDQDQASAALVDFRTLCRELMEAGAMPPEDTAVIDFARAAARIQRNPGPRASENERTLVLRLALEACTNARAIAVTARDELVAAVAGTLLTNLVRKDQQAGREHRDVALDQACREAAELFVDRIWRGRLGGRLPNQTQRQILSATYGFAFAEMMRLRVKSTPPTVTNAA